MSLKLARPDRYSTIPRQKGFTLLELLAVILISVALIALLSRLQWMVGKAGDSVGSRGGDWLTEQFMRNQAYAVERRLFKQPIFQGESQRLRFISLHSARYGHDSVPVLVEYSYDATREKLRYRERVLPPWWDEDDREQWARRAMRYFEQPDSERWFALVALDGVDALSFSYSAGDPERWEERWGSHDKLPAMIRVSYKRGPGSHSFILEPLVLSSYMSSGSW